MILALMIFKAVIFTIIVVLALDLRKSSRDVNDKFSELLSLYGVDEIVDELASTDSTELDSEERTSVSQHVHDREEAFNERIARIKQELDAEQSGERVGSEAGVLHKDIYNIDHAEADKEITAERNNEEEYSE